MISLLARLGLVVTAWLCCVATATAAGPPPEQRQGPPPEQRSLPRPPEHRVALVIGNAAYKHTTPLANPGHDARDIGAALERTGFEVILAVDASKAEMDGALRAFAEKLTGAEVALFYYAGHGLQVGNENYLVPVEARLGRERDLAFEAVRLDFVLRQMEIDREGKTTIVMLDACRDNPLSRNLARSMGTRSAAVGQGLAPASTGVGTFIAYSTQPGNVALDGKGRNSPFTAALVQHITTPGRNLNATMIAVRRSVISATDGRQVPWDHSALTGDFYFVPSSARPAVGTIAKAPAAKSDDVEALKARLKALEEAEKQRSAAASAGREQSRDTTAPGRGSLTGAAGGAGLSPEDVARLAEARARLAVADDKAKDLQRSLLEKMREEGQARDPAERQSMVRERMRIQLEMTKASQLAGRLRREIAALAPPPAPPSGPAAAATAPKGGFRPSRSERGFDVYEAAALAGTEIKRASGDSIAGCINACRNTRECVAVTRLLSAQPREACIVYSAVTRIAPDATGLVSALKPEVAGTIAGGVPRFDVVDNVRLDGEMLRAGFRAPSADACRLVCIGEEGCNGFQHGRRVPFMGQCQLFSTVTSRSEDPTWRAGVRAGQ